MSPISQGITFIYFNSTVVTMTDKNLFSPVQNIIFFNTLIKLSGFAKFSLIVGSYSAFFSAVAIVTPLSGAFGGIAGCFCVFGMSLLIKALLVGFMPLYFLAYHIPGLFASLYWATQSKAVRIAPAVISMALFLTHPVGASAALYSLFWLIPVYTTFFGKDTIFTRALGSTFTAHAVGSVIWLYTVPMNSDYWLMLIPLVVIERALFTIGMVATYKALFWVCTRSIVPVKKVA